MVAERWVQCPLAMMLLEEEVVQDLSELVRSLGYSKEKATEVAEPIGRRFSLATIKTQGREEEKGPRAQMAGDPVLPCWGNSGGPSGRGAELSLLW